MADFYALHQLMKQIWVKGLKWGGSSAQKINQILQLTDDVRKLGIML